MKLSHLGTLGAALVIAVACSTGGGATTAPATTAPVTAAPVTAAPATATAAPATTAPESMAPESMAPESMAPESRTVVTPAGEPLHIVFWGVLSTADASLGIDSQRGVELAIAAHGPVAGRDVLLTSEDGQCSSDGGNAAASRIASDPTVVGLIGSSCSDETVGGIELITNADLTTISPSNTRPALTAADRGPEYAGYLRTAHNDEFQGSKAAEFVYNVLGIRKAATIHDGSSYAQALQQVFADNFTELGGTITLQTAVGADDTDMTSVLTNVAATEPEFIYYPVFTGPFGYITAQVRDIPGLETVGLMGADAAFSAAALEAAGPNALDMYLSSPDIRQFPAGYQDFLTAHLEEYGENPISIFHAHAYDATNMLFDAIEKVAVEEADGSLSINLGDLRAAIYATTDFPGITGTLTCGPTGDCGAPAIGVYQITQAVVDDPQAAWPPQAIWPEL